MTQSCGAHRPPRAGVDVIDSADAALAVVELAMSQPLTAETIVVVLDECGRGRSIVVVDGTDDADALYEVVERLAESVAAAGVAGALVVASVRPTAPRLPGDDQRWAKASDLAEVAGVELLEWFVVGHGPRGTAAWCPRELLDEPPRWSRR